MCRADGDNVMSNDGTAATSMEGPYRFHYDAAVEAMQRDCCERLVFARHGVLGVRLIKLLLQHHNMEDRMLAEEAIATLPRTREVLHAMMRDGYVRQQEVPKSGVMMDRQPKNAVFLWSCSMEREVLPTVRVQVAKTLHNTLVRLSMERQAAANHAAASSSSSTSPAAAAVTVTGDASGIPAATGTRRITAENLGETLRLQRAVVALESSASALMRMMLVLDYY
ncbi:hypothetical protein DQ04_14081010 [Trypanosoma grayi]|uniref:hypothetical protein n=1 Tax=Trypanosoma grayi TaxID=71804 RepID=UPI0004F4A962|nr:hypothetical protein DQ04_14081010 [Trypanosoma grayi]KEG06407.1 hypothetical protein DQ04_14081010 [Trypanosoma grayi]